MIICVRSLETCFFRLFFMLQSASPLMSLPSVMWSRESAPKWSAGIRMFSDARKSEIRRVSEKPGKKSNRQKQATAPLFPVLKTSPPDFLPLNTPQKSSESWQVPALSPIRIQRLNRKSGICWQTSGQILTAISSGNWGNCCFCVLNYAHWKDLTPNWFFTSRLTVWKIPLFQRRKKQSMMENRWNTWLSVN